MHSTASSPATSLAEGCLFECRPSKHPIECLQGVETRRGEAAKALLSWPAAVYAAAASLLITPLAALTVLFLPIRAAAPGLALGLAAWYCVPTTLSRSISLTEVRLCRV